MNNNKIISIVNSKNKYSNTEELINIIKEIKNKDDNFDEEQLKYIIKHVHKNKTKDKYYFNFNSSI